MRHRRATRKLSRSTSNRKALMRSLLASLIAHERISTTYAKAKEAGSLTDRLITLGKRNTITSKKTAIEILGSKLLINKIFDEIAPRFSDRAGGYTRVLQLMPRKGDGAKMGMVELTERKAAEKHEMSKEAIRHAKAKKEKPREEKKPVSAAPSAEKQKAIKEKTAEETIKEKAKGEQKKLAKGFFKGLRRYFRGKST